MGRERECRATWDGATSAGRLLLETDELLFRGERRLRIALRDIREAGAQDGVLRVRWAAGSADFELGPAADDWARLLLHPKGRLEKLGVDASTSVRLVDLEDAGFGGELGAAGALIRSARTADLSFLGASTPLELRKVAALAKGLVGAQALWIVYPKGRKDITEAMVIDAGRRAGLKDVKVVRFSDTHTALKFVVPKTQR